MKQKKDKKFVSNENISPPLFGNKLLDAFTRTHIAIPVGLFFAYAIGLIYWTVTMTDLAIWQVTALFFGGWFVFTFVEYHVHKRLYHMDHKNASPKRKEMSYKLHGVHHDFPKDKQRLAMPPVVSIIISTTLLFLLELVLDKYSFSFLAGFLVGYASYLIVHYIVHIFRAPNNIFKALWTNHAIHHYQSDQIMFGVSSPIWDYVYGTLPPNLNNSNKTPVEVTGK